MHETTKKEFERFVEAFHQYAQLFGLQGYRLNFYCEPLEGHYAEIVINEMGRVASVTLTAQMDDDAYAVWMGPEASAKHECLHLFIFRLQWLANERFLNPDEVQNEVESLVHRLDNVIPNLPVKRGK